MTSATTKTIRLGGIINLVSPATKGTLTKPTIALGPQGSKSGTFRVSTLGPNATFLSTGLFDISDVVKKSVSAKTRKITGVLHAPLKDTAAVSASDMALVLSSLCETVIKPGDRVGTISVTVTMP